MDSQEMAKNKRNMATLSIAFSNINNIPNFRTVSKPTY